MAVQCLIRLDDSNFICWLAVASTSNILPAGSIFSVHTNISGPHLLGGPSRYRTGDFLFFRQACRPSTLKTPDGNVFDLDYSVFFRPDGLRTASLPFYLRAPQILDMNSCDFQGYACILRWCPSGSGAIDLGIVLWRI